MRTPALLVALLVGACTAASAAPVETPTAAYLAYAKGRTDVTNVEVTKETVTGDKAVLEAKGVRADGRAANLKVSLFREDGVWKVRAFTDLTPRAEKSCADLISAMKGSSMPDSNEAAGQVWHRCPDSVPALVEILSHEDSWNRTLAAQALGKMGPKAKAGLPGMEAAAKVEKDDIVKKYLTDAIQNVRK